MRTESLIINGWLNSAAEVLLIVLAAIITAFLTSVLVLYIAEKRKFKGSRSDRYKAAMLYERCDDICRKCTMGMMGCAGFTVMIAVAQLYVKYYF